MQSIESKIATVDGWLNPKEGRRLYQLAKNCRGRGAIVEIGSWKGKSTIWLAEGSRVGGNAKVHAIDPHTGSPEHSKEFGTVWTFDEFRRNIEAAGVSNMVMPHVDFSDSVAGKFNERVEFIFIDGLHDYKGVKTDFRAWFPKVVEGGTMAFHDTTCWPGVLKLVKEKVFKSHHFRKIRFTSSIVHAQKIRQNSTLDRMQNRVMLLAFLIHAWIERCRWKVLHNYLDFPITRTIIAYLKKRQAKPITLATER